MGFISKKEADICQTILNKEIKGEDTSKEDAVPASVRENLEHRARSDEHPPEH